MNVDSSDSRSSVVARGGSIVVRMSALETRRWLMGAVGGKWRSELRAKASSLGMEREAHMVWLISHSGRFCSIIDLRKAWYINFGRNQR